MKISTSAIRSWTENDDIVFAAGTLTAVLFLFRCVSENMIFCRLDPLPGLTVDHGPKMWSFDVFSPSF